MDKAPLSPIFPSSLELLEHAIEHLKFGTPRDLRLAVLHADNAIELLLKELARFSGIRLVDKKGRSVSYYECIDRLEKKGIKIPGLPDIDILHTERNSIYHIGGQPDKKKAEWLVYEVALNLATRICIDKFDYDIKAFSNEFTMSSAIMHDVEITNSEITNKYQKEALSAFNVGIFDASIVASYTAIEVFLREGIPIDLRRGIGELEVLIRDELISRDELHDIIVLRNLRNKVLHEGYSATKEEATLALETSKRIIGIIDSVLM